MIQAGDVRGAVRALDEARTIDPVAPGLAEVSQLMAERFKTQAEAAELELQRSRASAPAQRAASPASEGGATKRANTNAERPGIAIAAGASPCTFSKSGTRGGTAARETRTGRSSRDQAGAFTG